MEIIPALMPRTFKDLCEGALLFRGVAETLQVDIVDGEYVPNPTWPYARGGISFEDIEEEGLPFLSELSYEIDLMVSNPLSVSEYFLKLGASRLLLHVETVVPSKETIERARIGEVEVGVAIQIETDLGVLEEIADVVDVVQFMGIAEIGKQGEPFDERVVGKIQSFRHAHPDTIVSVDGGVTMDSAKLLQGVGVERLAIGSSILKARDPIKAFKEFQNI